MRTANCFGHFCRPAEPPEAVCFFSSPTSNVGLFIFSFLQGQALQGWIPVFTGMTKRTRMLYKFPSCEKCIHDVAIQYPPFPLYKGEFQGGIPGLLWFGVPNRAMTGVLQTSKVILVDSLKFQDGEFDKKSTPIQ